MKEIDIFKKFMEWMKMRVSEEKTLENGNTLIQYHDTNIESDKFTKVGYDEFMSGVIFDKNGNIVSAYLDSHVAFMSENAKLMFKM